VNYFSVRVVDIAGLTAKAKAVLKILSGDIEVEMRTELLDKI
jgi:hypothetical protein